MKVEADKNGRSRTRDPTRLHGTRRRVRTRTYPRIRPQRNRGSSPSPPANPHLDGTTAQATADNSSPTGASLNALSATLPRPSTDPCTRSGALHSTSRQALPRSLGVCACSSSRPLPPSGLPARALWPSPALRPISRPRRTPGVSSGWRGRSTLSRR